MKTTKTSVVTRHKNTAYVVLVTAFILTIPLVAMQFSDEVDWKPYDFAIAGALLISTGITYDLVTRKLRKTTHRVVLSIVLAAALLLVWAELAVGVLGTPLSGS